MAAPKETAKSLSSEPELLIYFELERGYLTDEEVLDIETLAKRIKSGQPIELIGYTEVVENEIYNVRLIDRRINAVTTQLKKHGISEENMTIVKKHFPKQARTQTTNNQEVWVHK